MATDGKTKWYGFLSHTYQIGYVTDIAELVQDIVSECWVNTMVPEDNICRHVVNDKLTSSQSPVPFNYTVAGAVLPRLEVLDLTWDALPWPNDTIEFMKRSFGPNLLGGPGYLASEKSGTLIFYDLNPIYDTQRNLGDFPNDTTYPPPIIFTGTKKILLAVSSQAANNCTPVATNPFGNATLISNLKNLIGWVPDAAHLNETCYLLGAFNITVGVVNSSSSRFVTDNVIEPILGGDSDLSVKPSIWIEVALIGMADLLLTITQSNDTRLSTWDNKDDYVNRLIKISYMAVWDAFYPTFDDTSLVDLSVGEASPMFQAAVGKIRVGLWLGINILLTASGIILLWLQDQRCKGPIVNDGPAAALMTDTSLLDSHFRSQMSGLSYVTSEDSREGMLRLVRDANENDEIGYGLKLTGEVQRLGTYVELT
ncbi:hypothetical protein G7Y89_g1168 [Cudoniella acicularis]|uniref:Uncharacterized protein n=1 Tax=Cudoniella acicularis TaxID=354080 RepID=A0A8H4W9S7_9HELO|nr:hypothetical protein G7Y89_g1168 [Cudoniella acicularis]